MSEDDLADLIARVTESTSAYIRGEMRRYFSLVPPAEDFSLFPPYGGEAIRGADTSDERIEQLERMFKGGEAALDIVQVIASGDLAVVVAVERQHGLVLDFPDQDWSLRITLVFRREGSAWRLVHRHTDPLVKSISMEELSAIARG